MVLGVWRLCRRGAIRINGLKRSNINCDGRCEVYTSKKCVRNEVAHFRECLGVGSGDSRLRRTLMCWQLFRRRRPNDLTYLCPVLNEVLSGQSGPREIAARTTIP